MVHSHFVQLILLLGSELVFESHCEADVKAFDLAFDVEHFVELGQRLLFIH